MARAPTPPPRANLSTEQAQHAISRLETRIRELQELDLSKVQSADESAIQAVQARIKSTLASIYGEHSAEYRRLIDAADIDLTVYVMVMFEGGRGTSPQEIREGLNRGRNRAISLLEGEVVALKERPDIAQAAEVDPAKKILRAYEGLDLHPEISRAASDLYRNGHYANSIEDAVKGLNDLVRLRSGEALDGTSLMEKVFSPKNPVLRFNEMKDQSDQDEQKGFMMMFSGAVAGLRNPRAHRLIKDDAERALEFIAFISLLAKLLDGAKK